MGAVVVVTGAGGNDLAGHNRLAWAIAAAAAETEERMNGQKRNRFGLLLRMWRERAGWSQLRLAAAMFRSVT